MRTGYLLTKGKYYYFYETAQTRKSKLLAQCFISQLLKPFKDIPEEMRIKTITDNNLIKEIYKNIDLCTIEFIELKTINFYKITGKNFSISLPEGDYKQCFINVKSEV